MPYLDENGLIYLWSKIKSHVTNAIANKVDKVSGKGLSTNDYTTAEKNKLSGIATGAEVNQNAFSNVKVGSSTVAADTKTDTLEIAAGSNVTLTPDTTNDKVTIAAKDTTYSAFKGATEAADGTTGLVPAPTGEFAISKFLCGDGTWKFTPGGLNSIVTQDGVIYIEEGTNINANGSNGIRTRKTAGADENTSVLIIEGVNATGSAAGMMSAADKGRIDNLYKRIAGYATTAGTTSAYTATITGATLTAGTMIALRFNAANAANATLNLNGLGAKPIYYKGAVISAGRAPANAVMLLVYDTTQVTSGAWHLIYSYDSNTTYSPATQSAQGLMSAADKTKLDGIAAGANNYVHPTTAGNKHIPAGGATGQILRWSAAGTAVWGTDKDTTYKDFEGVKWVGSTWDTDGKQGLVPAPIASKDSGTSVLVSGGGWRKIIPLVSRNASEMNIAFGIEYDDSTAIGNEEPIFTATPSLCGVMSAADKAKLDSFGAASTYALKSDITGMYKYKGSVASVSALPTTGQRTGDVYNIETASIYGGAGMNVAWDGTKWDPLGEIFSITSITNARIDAICV